MRVLDYMRRETFLAVTPAKAGVQHRRQNWIPAFAGMTPVSVARLLDIF